MKHLLLLLAIFCTFLGVNLQRAPPGVNPHNYQHQQQPQYQQQVPHQQQYQQQVPIQQQVPVQQQQIPVQQQQIPGQQQQVPVQQQQYQQQQQQIPVQQQYQQAPVQHQVPMQQVPHQQQVPHHHGATQHGHGQRQIFNTGDLSHEKEHIQEHMEVPIDTSKMTDQELQFHYFKMHDADNNNKLDGCELIKSLIHWHDEEKNTNDEANLKEKKIYSDKELLDIVDLFLDMYDGNHDGFVSWVEFMLKSKFKSD